MFEAQAFGLDGSFLLLRVKIPLFLKWDFINPIVHINIKLKSPHPGFLHLIVKRMENTVGNLEETGEPRKNSKHEVNSKGYLSISGAASKHRIPEDKTAEVKIIAHMV